jgi:predicted dehydrogenase/nucleoside-diphosphate-sugar epimerase
MSSNQTRVGVVGAGYVSAYHLRALQTLPHVTVVGIADIATSRAQQLAAQFGIPKVYRTLAEMREARPDVIHILTPPTSHCPLAIEALEMGCHVFVEKPLAPTGEECDRMIAAARRAGRVLSVNHSARMDPVILQGLKLLEQGACGDVLAVDFFRGSDYPLYAGGPMPAPFRQGGYPFQDMGVHALYLMEAFLGTIRDADIRYRSTGKNPNVFFDEWRGTVECAKGVGQMYLSWSVRPMRNELYIHGTRGYMHLDCFLQTCTVHKSLPGPKAIQASVDAVTHALGTLHNVPRNMLRFVRGKLRPSPGIHAGVLQFHDALSRGVEPPVSVEEGRRMVVFAEGITRRADADRDRALRLSDPVKPARILVTGAAGFLGTALLNRLQSQGETVRILLRKPSAQVESLPGVHAVYGDLGDPEAVDRAVAGVDLVYHVGATMRGRGWGDFESGTVWGTRNILESCRRHGVKRLVYVSSVTVLDYAGPRAGAVVDESAAVEPHPEERGAYTQSKLQAERLVLDAIRDQQLPAIILRPGQIFGRGAESIPPYGTIAIGGRWVVIGSGKLRLPLVYVEDVVDAMLQAACTNVTESVFQLVDSTPITQNEYIEQCRTALGTSLKVMHAPRAFLFAAGTALEILGKLLHRGVPLSRYRLRSIKELRFDCSAAEDKLGWKPVIGVTGGFREMFEDAQKHDVVAASR